MSSSKLWTRREVLRGAGGVAVALPFLPSLRPGPAYGADPVVPRQRRFIAMTTDQGCVRDTDLFPMATERKEIYPGHTIAYGGIKRIVEGGRAHVSAIISGPPERFSEKMATRLNLLRGLDHQMGYGHQMGSHLGNFQQENRDQSLWCPTIDQLAAWSPSFYPQATNIRERSIRVGSRHVRGGAFSFFWEKPQTRSGRIVPLDSTSSSRALFDRLFGGSTAQRTKRKPVVDYVLADFKRLRNSGTRMSSEDRARLDAHMDRLAELDRRLAAGSAACTDGANTAPSEDSASLGDTYKAPEAARKKYQLHNEVVALALSCGATRVAVYNIGESFSAYPGEWHGEVIHTAAHNKGLYEQIRDSYQRVFEGVFLDLATRLDAVEDTPGRSILDDSLMTWSHESGPYVGHRAGDLPVITLGSAGGALKTGLYVDYRNPTKQVWNEGFLPGGMAYSAHANTSGLPYAQWLVTVLEALGVPRAEYAPGGKPWFGEHRFSRNQDVENPFMPEHYVDGVFDNAHRVLPLLGT